MHWIVWAWTFPKLWGFEDAEDRFVASEAIFQRLEVTQQRRVASEHRLQIMLHPPLPLSGIGDRCRDHGDRQQNPSAIHPAIDPGS